VALPRRSERLLAAPVLAPLSLRLANAGKKLALRNYPLFLRAASSPPELLDALSAPAALRAAEHARRRVPAYRAFLAEHGWHDDPRLPATERLERLPVMDKANYVTTYSTEERCLDGRIPLRGTQIDESSGSSGTPFNWVRSRAELHELHRELAQFARYLCGTNVITINGFSMGAWATGVNVGEALRYNGIVKSTGPDVEKILHTLNFFGPRYHYVLTGYPPFLKHLVDESEARGFDWGSYRIIGLVGGEGMSEGLRAYLERRFQTIYSGYGASDLDMGVAGEFPLTVWIRRRAAADARLQQALFGSDSRLPMLFQFNPLDYHVETNALGELIVTINRLSVLSPRIRYNIHDAGGIVRFDSMLALLRDFGLDPVPECHRADQPIFRMPFLYLFGRSDSTISYMGANIYPQDIEQALFADGDDARRLGSYCLELLDLGGGEQRPCIHVELLDGATDDGGLGERLRTRVVDRLLATNLDFRSAASEDAAVKDFRVLLHPTGTGPFAADGGRIKRRYIVPALGAR
jgi:phenylacetate-CoA ligase